MNLQTKADFTALMHKFLDPLKPYYSAGCARLHLGETGVTYNQNAIELEAFSRPLWALVPFWVGGGSEPEFETIYRKGLAAGADPENPEYWGTTGEYDQCYVEMAAIACGILTAPESCGPRFLTPKNRTLLHGWGRSTPTPSRTATGSFSASL